MSALSVDHFRHGDVLPEVHPIWNPLTNLPHRFSFRGAKPKFNGMRLYVGGPMTNYPQWNFPAFDRARNRLLRLGYEVISPADLDRARGFTQHTTVFPPDAFHVAIRIDTVAILISDGIFLLKGWEHSTGAKFESSLAQIYGQIVLREDGADPGSVEIRHKMEEIGEVAA